MWGCEALDQRPHLVRWATLCLDKRKWGLGAKSLSILNSLPPFANGVGALRMREGFYGTKELGGNIGKNEEGGILGM